MELTPESTNALFTYGPTKNAVILRNMVQDIDGRFGGRMVSRKVGQFLATLDALLSPLTDKSLSNSPNSRLGFWEGRAWKHVNEAMENDIFHFLPEETVYVIRAVAKEKILRARVIAGLDKPKDHGYSTKDIPEWLGSELARSGRNRWKKTMAQSYAKVNPVNLMIRE